MYSSGFMWMWIVMILFYCSIHHELAVAGSGYCFVQSVFFFHFFFFIFHRLRRRRLFSIASLFLENLVCVRTANLDLPQHQVFSHPLNIENVILHISNMILITYLTTRNEKAGADTKRERVEKSAAHRISDLFRQCAFSFSSLFRFQSMPPGSNSLFSLAIFFTMKNKIQKSLNEMKILCCYISFAAHLNEEERRRKKTI